MYCTRSIAFSNKSNLFSNDSQVLGLRLYRLHVADIVFDRHKSKRLTIFLCIQTLTSVIRKRLTQSPVCKYPAYGTGGGRQLRTPHIMTSKTPYPFTPLPRKAPQNKLQNKHFTHNWLVSVSVVRCHLKQLCNALRSNVYIVCEGICSTPPTSSSKRVVTATVRIKTRLFSFQVFSE